MNYCFSCGQKRIEGSKFCVACGIKLVNDNVNGREPKPETQINKSMEKKEWVFQGDNKKWLAGTIGFLLIVVFLFSANGKESPSAVAEEFIGHTINSDFSSGKRLWSESGQQYMISVLGDEGWITQSMENLSHRYYIETGSHSVLNEYTVISEEVEGSEATIEFEFVFDDGREEMAVFQMTNEEDGWKVFAFDSGRP